MSPNDRPTAVFAFNDGIAYGCYSCFGRHNIKVPEEISLVGFDQSEKFNIAFGSITTVDVNIEAMIEYTCWYLLGRITGVTPEIQAKKIDTKIIDCGTARGIVTNEKEN